VNLDTAHRDVRDDAGASLVEYALLVALIALVAFLAVTLLGVDLNESIDSSRSQLFPMIHLFWL
jgi:Flp pilus assembly pilin Flp